MPGIVQHLPHGVLVPEEAAGERFGQHSVRGGVQRRFAHLHRVAEEVEEAGVCRQHMGLMAALAPLHEVILQQDESAPLLHLAVRNIGGVQGDPVGMQYRRIYIAVNVLQGNHNAPTVHAVRVRRVLAVQVTRQHDAAAQAQGQADDVDKGVSFGTCQVACRVFQGFHNALVNDNLSI